MIARLQEVDPVVLDEADEAVLFRQPPGPGSRREMLQRLRAPHFLEEISDDDFDEIWHPLARAGARPLASACCFSFQ